MQVFMKTIRCYYYPILTKMWLSTDFRKETLNIKFRDKPSHCSRDTKTKFIG